MSAVQVFWKNCGKKEKLLITSNFSFSHSVFYLVIEPSAIFIKFIIVIWKLFDLGTDYNLSFGKGLNVAQMVEFVYDRVQNIAVKEENAGYQHIILSLKFIQPFNKIWGFQPVKTESLCGW